MAEDALKHYLETAIREYRQLKKQAERSIEQLDDEEFFRTIDPESNSIAVIIKHMAGNMRSRWVDFLTSDGEKPDRNRDQEFIIQDGTSRETVMQWWEQGWQAVFDAVEALGPGDLMRTVFIRREPHTVIQAIERQMTHYASHTGQIIFLAKHLKSADWKTLSIPRKEHSS
ncbi:MAG: DUF1572 family protein [Acidobacteriota bacterium]|nr:MAG: DUF1572 family protein [Acidobacteriota bacterium]